MILFTINGMVELALIPFSLFEGRNLEDEIYFNKVECNTLKFFKICGLVNFFWTSGNDINALMGGG